MNMGNLIVGQSGGPTSVINSSLAGVYKTAKDRGANKVYGMIHGVKGLLEGRYVDLANHVRTDLDLELLMRTPSSFLGTCRYKLPEIGENDAIYEDIFRILYKLDIRYLLYIGGNDSMDTIYKLYKYATVKNININFMGVPKTIDNDVAVTDHTPGFGSAAKYIGAVFKELIRDGLVYGTEQVSIIEIMGRNAGWLTAAASLAKGEDCEGPDMILLPEVPFQRDVFLERMETMVRLKKSVVIAVSEGVKLRDGRYVCELTETPKPVDPFGHKSLGGAAFVLANLAAKQIGCKTRPIDLGALQRSAAHIVSRVDITEAYQAGGQAVKSAFNGETGKVIIFTRTSDDPYDVITESVDAERVANIEKKVPLEWITENGTYVAKELTDYIRPLIQSELTPIMVNGLPRHLLLNPML